MARRVMTQILCMPHLCFQPSCLAPFARADWLTFSCPGLFSDHQPRTCCWFLLARPPCPRTRNLVLLPFCVSCSVFLEQLYPLPTPPLASTSHDTPQPAALLGGRLLFQSELGMSLCPPDCIEPSPHGWFLRHIHLRYLVCE